MDKLVHFLMYVLWGLTLIGVLLVTFTSFRYEDLNVIVAVLAAFTLLNTYFEVKRPKK